MSTLLLVTLVHTAICLVAIAAGIPAVAGLLRPAGAPAATRFFLWAAFLASATGFLFPGLALTPAVIVGVVALAILAAVALAARSPAPAARRVVAGGIVASLWLLVFVAIAQAFQKIAPLNALAPTGSEPAFAIAQLAALALFAVLGVAATRGAGAPARRAAATPR